MNCLHTQDINKEKINRILIRWSGEEAINKEHTKITVCPGTGDRFPRFKSISSQAVLSTVKARAAGSNIYLDIPRC